MRILYVTDAWHGFSEALFEGATSINGLPSFGRILEKLIIDGHKIDFIIIRNEQPDKSDIKLNIGLPWLKESQILGIIQYGQGNRSKIRALTSIVSCSFRVMKKKRYDFVYAHGLVAGYSIFAAMFFGIPFGQRLYGTFLWDEYRRNPNALGQLAFWKNYYNTIAFRYRKAFLLMTNDGSRGDLVYDKVRRVGNKFTFLYWVNGVKRVEMTQAQCNEVYQKHNINAPYIFYPARFDRWKNQDRVVRIVKRLHEEGFPVHCCFAGSVTVTDYYQEVVALVKEASLENYIHFLGNIEYHEIAALHRGAVASLSLYSVCNFTNVFHEMMANGAVAIVKKDGVVDDIIINGENGFLVSEDDREVVEIFKNTIRSADLEKIRNNAIKTSAQYIKTWDERITDEIAIIQSFINKKVNCSTSS